MSSWQAAHISEPMYSAGLLSGAAAAAGAGGAGAFSCSGLAGAWGAGVPGLSWALPVGTTKSTAAAASIDRDNPEAARRIPVCRGDRNKMHMSVIFRRVPYLRQIPCLLNGTRRSFLQTF